MNQKKENKPRLKDYYRKHIASRQHCKIVSNKIKLYKMKNKFGVLDNFERKYVSWKK